MHNAGMPDYPPHDSRELQAFLRPAQEPMRTVGDALVHSILLADLPAYLDYLERALRDIADGAAQLILPPKAVFEDGPGQGDFRVMPCVTRQGDRVIKSVKVVGTNLVQRQVPDQVTVGKAMLLHAEENHVTHLFDANALSSIRTGACIALAVKLLAPRRQRIRLFGAGRVGFYGAAALCALGGVASMEIIDPVPNRADALARHLASRNAGMHFSTPAEMGGATDVVVLATTSTVPFCRPPAGGAGLIVSVGADTDYQRELDAGWANRAALYVDTLDSARFGDLRQWLADGRICGEALKDVFDALRRKPAADKPILFVSTGSALFDNLTMAYVADRLPLDCHSSETKSSSL